MPETFIGKAYALEGIENMKAARVGVVGAGFISDVFFDNMINVFSSVEVVGCAARNLGHVKAKAEKYGIIPMSMDEMLTDGSIDLIVNLTPVPAHYDIIKRALEHGKHVYTEKSLALNCEQAQELLDLAKSKGLRLGCAPDTFLGSGIQTAIEAVNGGMIGDITGFSVMINRGLDLLYEFMGFLTKPGGGIGYDLGVYALTALFSMLGPADEVCGFAQTNRPQRVCMNPMFPSFGNEYSIENENLMSASARMRNGALGSVMFNGDSSFPERPFISLQGTKGLLYLPDPNEFGGNVIYVPAIRDLREIRNGGEPEKILPVRHKYSQDSRGIGVADMALSIYENRPHRASAEMACHVLEFLDGVVESSKSKRYKKLASVFEKPQPLTGNEAF